MQWSTSTHNIKSLMMQRFQNLLKRLASKSWLHKKNTTHLPLLHKKDLQQLRTVATSHNNQPITSLHEVKTWLLGERTSVYAGSGYEFAENQLYVTGDDSRFINWRMLAKTGKLYRKVFNEERRPELWVVVDKRASMRFGTKQRLKVTQAAIHALVHVYQAQQQQLACGGVILSETPSWFKPTQNSNAIHALCEQIIAPTPPLFSVEEKEYFDTLLRQLIERLSAGSIVILISDFYDLNPNMLGTLHSLAATHTVIAKHIIDPIEINLPAHGKFQVLNLQDTESTTLDCDDQNFKEDYRIKMQQQHHQIKQQLIQAGVNYQQCLSDETIINEGSNE